MQQLSMTIKIIKTKISKHELEKIAQENYGEMTKGVADIKRKIIALGGELHADAEALLLEKGSKQADLWGFNIYPAKSKDKRIEYTSLINVRPKQGNRSMEIKDKNLRKHIREVIDLLIE